MCPGSATSISIVPATIDLLKGNLDKILEIDAPVIGEVWTESNFLLELPGKWRYSMLAFGGDELAGFAIFSCKNQVVHLHRIAVRAAFRRLSIASSMVKATAKFMKKQNLTTMTAKIHTTNIAAQSFFQSLGFVRIETSGTNILLQSNIAPLLA